MSRAISFNKDRVNGVSDMVKENYPSTTSPMLESARAFERFKLPMVKSSMKDNAGHSLITYYDNGESNPDLITTGNIRAVSPSSTLSSESSTSAESGGLFPIVSPSSFRQSAILNAIPALGGQGAFDSENSRKPILGDAEDLADIPKVYVEKPSPNLHCRLCNQVFSEPTITSCGHTYCRVCVTNSGGQKCPVDDRNLSVVLPNITVSEQIGELSVHCRYGVIQTSPDSSLVWELDPRGCPATIKLNSRTSHEAECGYAPVTCPNNSKCPSLIRMDLEKHLKTCKHVKCPNSQFCCPFVGLVDDLEHHLSSECKMEPLKDFLKRSNDQYCQLVKRIDQKENEVDYLRNLIYKIGDRMDHLDKTVNLNMNQLGRDIKNLSLCERDTRKDTTIIKQELSNINILLNSGTVGQYDPQQIFKCKGTFVGHQGPVWCMCVHGDLLFSGSSDKHIKVWDTTPSYKCIKTLEGHQDIVLTLAVASNRLYSGSADCSIAVWNIDSFVQEKAIPAHEKPVCTLVTTSRQLFSGSLKSIKVWDLHTLKLKQEISGLNHWVRALYVTDKYLYSGSYQVVNIWDLNTLKCVSILTATGGSVYSLQVTNQHIIAGTYENCINVYDVNTFEVQETLTGHFGVVYDLAIMQSPGNTRLFSASYDRTVRVWNMDILVCTQILLRHTGSVASLAVSRGRIFSGAIDSMIKVWQ